MNEMDLFSDIQKKKKSEILDLLKNAYFEMSSEQQQSVFGELVSNKIKTTKLKSIDANKMLEDISDFNKESMSGYYYAPFDIDSKNFMDIPEETSEWCNKVGQYLDQTSQLSIQGFHKEAIQCFQLLFGLIDNMCEEDIVFADELGPWMVGGDEKQACACYINSLAECCTPEDFVKHMIPLLKKDSHESFSNKIFKQASSIANKDQVSLLKNEAKRLNIKVK